MLRLDDQDLIPIGEVQKHLPVRPGGKRIHKSVVYRWALKGVRGVRLETLHIGGRVYTSLAALQQFTQRTYSVPAGRQGPGRVDDTSRSNWVGQRLELELGLKPGHLRAVAGEGTKGPRHRSGGTP